ncbi:MAG TPA: hypothetical protein V6D26_00630 [Stenomitos sp.]
MTYATITTTKEVLETIQTSQYYQNQPLPMFKNLFQKLGRFNSVK